MNRQELFETLREKFRCVLEQHQLLEDEVTIACRALSAQEAIGDTKRRDFPIITGKDIMIEAQVRGCRGQAFTDAPTAFSGSLREVLEMDIVGDAHARGLFIAALNAVMASLGYCRGTVHCRTEGPEQCAQDMLGFLRAQEKQPERIALIGYQPALLEMLARSTYEVRVLDLNPANIGQNRYGVTVEHGQEDKDDVIAWADLILCTGSTLCNGTIVDYMDIGKRVLFFGITLAGSAPLLGLERVCFADRYE